MEAATISPGMVRVDAWAQYPWLRAAFSSRLGGGSQAYGRDELNLGWTEHDKAELVATNRKLFVAAAVGSTNTELVTVRQTHSNTICQVTPSHGPLVTPEGKAVFQGDGLMTDVPGVLLGIQTADCVPVLVADTKKRVVAAYHAGWRGTLARIVEGGVAELTLRYRSDAADIVAAIGPCIGPCCFEVGEEVRYAFEPQFGYSDELFSAVSDDERKVYLNLVEANRRQLIEAGVAAKNISAVGECTSCARVEGDRRKYFSHRAEKGFTGRMLSVIGIVCD